MRTGALVLGVLGGIFGIMSAALAFIIGGLGDFFDAEGAETVVRLGWSALFFCLVGLVGAGLAIVRPLVAAVLMLISAIGVTISISLFAIIAAPLFLVGALLAFLEWREGRNTR
jgi:hypothetical protein